MTTTTAMQPYEARVISRSRSTKVELAARRSTLVDIARRAQPATVRHIYYRAVVEGLVPKSQNGYQRVQRDLVELRRAGEIPYAWIEDTGRRAHHPLVDSSASSALRWCAQRYRRDPWQQFDAPQVEIWCESRSIAGTLTELVDKYAVPVFPCGGQPSDSFTFEAARTYVDFRPVVVLYAGDYDPAGLEVSSHLAGKLRHHAADGVNIEFRRLSINDDQAEQMQMLGTPPKKKTWRDFDGTQHEFRGQSVELEAVDPVRLRQMFAQAVQDIAFEFFDRDIFTENQRIEADERARLLELSEGWSM